MSEAVEIRPLAARDSLAALTSLLHRAYAPLAVRGMNLGAATRTMAETERRAAQGQCFVAEQRGRVVGTVTVCGPFDLDDAPWTEDVPHFRDRDTAHFHQFAVDPGLQKQGIGRRLVSACEDWARARNYRRVALNTAEPAVELRALYRRLGFVEVAHVQWEGRTYRSVIMEKALDESPLRAQLRLLARYHVWATQELQRQLQDLPEADYRRDLGLFFRSVHGTLNHLLLVERDVWLPRLREGLSPAIALDLELEADRAALAQQGLAAARAWTALLDDWPEAQLLGLVHYRRRNGEAVALRGAAVLTHVFNHGTHHRGQISAALTALGRAAPELDLIYMLQREPEIV